ncbi:hypothetical protein BU17DRAFT_46246, partial [Hysterangium stoloniferum]
LDGEPRSLPLRVDPRVLLLAGETIRYNYSTPEANQEWLAIYPVGAGTYRLKKPADNRSVYVSSFHQLHCIQTFAKALLKTDRDHWSHIQHCLNFLRQITLCRPDLTLEQGRFTKKRFTIERNGTPHICRDWSNVYSTLVADMTEWDKIRNQTSY